MKRLTLDQTWEQCLAMWKWISRQCINKKRPSWYFVETLKMEWLHTKGIEHYELDHDCYFCEHDLNHRGMCGSCPARKIETGFHCDNNEYSWMRHPRLFYAKLKELNKIRLAKK